MKLNKGLYFLLVILLGIFTACEEEGDVVVVEDEIDTIVYPETRKVDTVDEYFGTEVRDPYRWLENDTAQEVVEWVQAQNKVTFDYLENIPYRDEIRSRLKELYNYERMGTPHKEGGKYYFFTKNDGLQDQSVIYIQEGLKGQAREYLDPNELSESGTVSISQFTVSNDGKYVAYSTQASGSDWQTYYVMDLQSKEMIDTLNWIKFSVPEWYQDGFFYSRFPQPKEGVEYSSQNKNQKVYYHKVGTSQSQDKLVYEDKQNPLQYFYSDVSHDGRWLALTKHAGSIGNALYFKDLKKGINAPLMPAITFLDSESIFVENIGNKLFVKTNYNAPNFKLVAVDPADPGYENWTDILPNQENMTLLGVNIADGKIIANYMKDATSKLFLFDTTGRQLQEIAVPANGYVDEEKIKTSATDSIFFFSYSSFTQPEMIYKYNLRSNELTVHFQPEVNFNPADYETKQEWYHSKDGTRIPIFIVNKKGLKKNGLNPAWLYAYGGFNNSKLPEFSASTMYLLENGFVYAQPTIRGGGEYGEKWHKGGMKLNKQNVFDDFISAAEFLISEKYTDTSKLVISGRSNGGLLVGAAMTQRPELFAVALPAVGVMDMLRFHKFTIGHAWVSEYGSSEDSIDFKNLYAYSPLHNLEEGVEYPATLVTTADHDDRVVPAHSFKYISTLQEKHAGREPVMIRIDTKAGHGSGKPVSMVIEETADIFAFVFKNLNEKPNGFKERKRKDPDQK